MFISSVPIQHYHHDTIAQQKLVCRFLSGVRFRSKRLGNHKSIVGVALESLFSSSLKMLLRFASARIRCTLGGAAGRSFASSSSSSSSSSNSRSFNVLGLQQVAIGGLDKSKLTALWSDVFGLSKLGEYASEKENVDEDIIDCGGVEIDLMQPLDPSKAPKVHVPPLNHLGLWVDDIAAAYRELENAGVRFAPGGIRKGAAGHDVCFIHPKGTDEKPLSGEGVLIELVQAPDAAKEIKPFLEKWADSFGGAGAATSSWTDTMLENATMVRPSGNPMGRALWEEMNASEEIEVKSHELLAMERCNVVGDHIAWVIATTRATFSYQGNENDDIAVYSLVLQKLDGEWKVAHAHRSTGRSPEDDMPSF